MYFFFNRQCKVGEVRTRNRERANLTAMMLKKSSSPSVSRMEETVCLAMVSLRPFMLPLTSTKMTTSFGDVAAWMYLRAEGDSPGVTWGRASKQKPQVDPDGGSHHFLFLQSKPITPCSSGCHFTPDRRSGNKVRRGKKTFSKLKKK